MPIYSKQSLSTLKCDSRILCASISSNTQQYLATGHEDSDIQVYQVIYQDLGAADDSSLPSLGLDESSLPSHDIKPILRLKGHKSPVTSLLISPGAEDHIMTGSDGGSLKYFDLKSERILRTFSPGHRAMITCLAFQPTFGASNASNSGNIFASGSLDTNLKIWDLRVKQASHTLKGHYKGVKCCKFTPDCKWIVSGSESGAVKVFDIVAGKELFSFNDAHTHAVTDIDFHPEEFLMASASADKTVKLWDLEAKQLVNVTPITSTKIQRISFVDASLNASSNEASLVAASKDNLRVWQFEPCRNMDHFDVSWPHLHDLKVNKDTRQIYGCSFQKNRLSLYTIPLGLMAPYGGDRAQQRSMNVKPKLGRIGTPSSGNDISASRPPAKPSLGPSRIENRPPFSTNFSSTPSPQSNSPNDDANPSRKPFVSQLDGGIRGHSPARVPRSRGGSSSHHVPRTHSAGSSHDHSDDIIFVSDLESSGKPIGLDLSSFLPQNSAGSRSGGVKDMSEKQLLKELMKEHKDMCKVMSSRLDNYKVIRRQWNKGERLEAVRSLNNLQDSATTTDVLLHLMKAHNTRYLTLDMCKYLLPLICGLLLSKVSHYHETALNASHILYKSFGQLIRQSLSAPASHVGVDLSKEARIQKCKHCREYFVQVQKIIKDKRMDERTDEIGELSRNVASEIEIFL